MATLQTIIDRAMYMSIEDRQYSCGIPGDLQNAALDTFIDILDENRYKIPFNEMQQTTTFEELSNTKFVSILQLQYILGGIKYDVRKVTLTEFNRIGSVIGLKSPPYVYYFDNLTQTIKVYPTPNTGDKFIIHGYKALEGMNLTDPIPTNLPRFMRSYLKYELANRLCTEYDRKWSGDKEKVRQKLVRMVEDASDVDVTPDINIEMGMPSSQGGEFPLFYYISGGSL